MPTASQKDKILGYLGLAARAGKLVMGRGPLLDGLSRDAVVLVLIAADAGQAVSTEVARVCQERAVPCYTVDGLTKYDLGSRLGRRAYSVVGLTSRDFARGIEDQIASLLSAD